MKLINLKQRVITIMLVSTSVLPSASAQSVQNTFDTSAASMAASSPRRMRIGAGDLLSVVVFDTPELSGQIRVDENGDASFPLIGDLHVAGLAASGAQSLIADRLLKGNFVKEPQVTVLIIEYATQGITMMGEVMKPGIYPIVGRKRLLDMISLASGLTPLAGTSVTITHRDQPDQPVTIALRGGEIGAGNIELTPGDIVAVQRAGVVYVIGDVGKPGGFVMEKPTVGVLETLALAQGPTKTASLDHARLLRNSPSGLEQLPLPLKKMLSAKSADVPLQPGDVVYVPSSGAKNSLQGGMQGIISSVAGAAIYSVSR